MVDSLITLFPSNATDFSTNGYGCLSETTSCTVTEERNGIFELTLKYPVDGRYYSLLTDDDMRKIIYVKPNPYDNKQAFRIYDISTPMNGIITINAAHISYDLSGFLLKPFTGTKTLQQAFDYFVNGSSVLPSMHNFSFINGMSESTASSFSLKKAATIRSMLGGEEGSILDLYKGEYKFDNFNIYLYSQRGQNSGVSIRYGKNLTDMDHDKACDGMYTGVYPYFYRENNNDDGTLKSVTSIEGNIQYIEGYSSSSDFRKIYPLDCTSDFSNVPEEPSESEKAEIKATMEQKATDFITNNEIGKPKVSIDVSFVALEQSEEFEQYKDLYTVKLCDTVNIYYPKLNINATEKCIKTVYNVLLGKYDSIELGEGRSNLVDQVASQNTSINNAINTATSTATALSEDFLARLKYISDLILNNSGGWIEFEYDNNTPQPHPIAMKIYVTDSSGRKTNNYWLYNSAGAAFYKNGNRANIAFNNEGKIAATEVTAGHINGSEIKGGSIEGAKLSTSGGIEIWNTIDSDSRPYVDLKWISTNDYDSRIYTDDDETETVEGYDFHFVKNYRRGYGYAYVNCKGVLTGSDKQLKKNLVPLEDKYKKFIDFITAYEYELKDGSNKIYFGFIAQDVQNSFKEIGLNPDDYGIVVERKDMVTGEVVLSLSYTEFIPILWSIVKDLKDRVEKLENQNKGD